MKEKNKEIYNIDRYSIEIISKKTKKSRSEAEEKKKEKKRYLER